MKSDLKIFVWFQIFGTCKKSGDVTDQKFQLVKVVGVIGSIVQYNIFLQTEFEIPSLRLILDGFSI